MRLRSELLEFDEQQFSHDFLIERLSGIGLPRPERTGDRVVGLPNQKIRPRLVPLEARLERVKTSFVWRGLPTWGQHYESVCGKGPAIVRTVLFRDEVASNESVFSDIYRRRAWGEHYESVSGQGSGIVRTALFRDALAQLFKELRVRTLIDAGCGDFNWMKLLAVDLEHYIGIDVVPDLIADNQRKYGNANTVFLNLDITLDELTRADLVLSRDCLVHLSSEDIFKALYNFKQSGSKYLLTNTFIALKENTDISSGGWRRLNLQLPPFNFPEPLRLIDEKCLHTGGIYSDKRLALWELKDIPI